MNPTSRACLGAAALLLCLAFPSPAQTLPVTSGLQLWLKADAGVTADANSKVSAWADQSGQNNHATQATPANAPTLLPGALNGLPVLKFANPQVLEVPNAREIAGLTNDVTVLVVGNFDNLSGYRGFLSKCAGGFPAPVDAWNNASQVGGVTAFHLNQGTAAYRQNALIVPPVPAYHVAGLRWKDGVADQFLNDFNNGSGTYTAVPTNSSSPLRIGRRTDGTIQLVGGIAEILIYKPALSYADTYNVITNYLQPKYALSFDIPAVASIAAPANGGSVTQNVPFPITVNTSDADGYATRVSVYANGTLLGTANAVTSDSSASYKLEALAPYPGQLTLLAVATDNWGRFSTSAPVVVTVSGSAPAAPVAAGLKVWLKADAGVTSDAQGAVTAWADQSGNANDAIQLDPALGPKLTPNVLNGKPVLRFNSASNSFLEINEPGTAFVANDFTTYAVARFVGGYPALRQHVWSKCINGVAAPVDWWLMTTTGLPYGYRGDGTYFAGTGNGPAGPTLGVFTTLGMSVTAADGVMAHYLGNSDNGSSLALTNTFSVAPLRIGRRDDGLTQLNGDIAELLIYDRALNAEERSNVVSYVQTKYNIVQPRNVSPAPAVAITSPANGQMVSAPATVSFSATASSVNGTITRVRLFANGNLFATLTNAPYQVPLDLLTPGTVTFLAEAQDNWGAISTATITNTVSGSASVPLLADGLHFHLAADQGVTTNAAGAVTLWPDQSGNFRDATSLDENTSPTLIPNALNGKPVVRYNGGNQVLEVYNETSFTAGDLTSFAFVRFANFASFRALWSKTVGNQPAPIDWYFNTGNGAATIYRGDGAVSAGVVGGAPPANAYVLVGFKAAGPAITHYLGYNANGAGTISPAPVDMGSPLRIGRRADGAVQMNGDIAEIVIYDRAVSDSERMQIANYFYSKYGVTVVQVANKPPVVALVSPTNGAPAAAPGFLSIVAQASDPDNAISRVDFLVNDTVVGSRATPPYQMPLDLLTPGAISVQAIATDVWGATGTSAPVVLNVTGAGPAAPPASGLVLWLKADTGVTTNLDGSVIQWSDQSGSGNHAVQDAIYGYPTPTLITDPVLNQPVLNFDGTLRYLVVASAASLALTNDLSIFYAASFDDFAAIRPLCGKTTLAQPHPFDLYVSTAGIVNLVRGDERGNGHVISARPLSAGTPVAGGVTVSGSQATHYLQGLPNGSASYQYGAIDDGTALTIGTRDALDLMMKGNLGELMFYNRALANGDLLQANAYLAGKFGVPTFQFSTQPPSLNVHRTSPGTFEVSWLPGYAGYVLEGRAAVGTGTWSGIATNPPGNKLTITTTNVTQFLRLRSQ